jgi:hypothetical protein
MESKCKHFKKAAETAGVAPTIASQVAVGWDQSRPTLGRLLIGVEEADFALHVKKTLLPEKLEARP